MEVLDVLLNSIQNDVRQVELLSNNLANSNTPGYQRIEVFSQFLTDAAIAQTVASIVENEGGIKTTGGALDVAIAGEGYFLLNKNGEAFLTRHGRFHVNSEGFLSHGTGALVQGEGGAINVSAEDIRINNQGEVLENGIRVARIQIVKPDAQSSVRSEGNGLYSTENFMPIEAQLVSGAINDAGANTSADMIRLIELSRHSQSLQKAIYALDQIRDAGINELGKKQ